MGVSGSGKTTIGRLLAEELGWSFSDADEFHSCHESQQADEAAFP
jgi:gluconokinase